MENINEQRGHELFQMSQATSHKYEKQFVFTSSLTNRKYGILLFLLIRRPLFLDTAEAHD